MDNRLPAGLRGRVILGKGNGMEELIKRLERVIQTGAPDKDGMHPISAETVLEVARGLSEHSTNLAEVGTDCINRQAAIDALTEYGNGRAVFISVGEAVIRIENLPPAEPKRGKWILDRSGAYCCSECMEPCAGYVMMKPRDKFCKMCGSRNEVTT